MFLYTYFPENRKILKVGYLIFQYIQPVCSV